MYIRSTIDEERLTRLALMNVLSKDTEEINTFAKIDKVDDMEYLYNIYLQLFLAVLAKPGTVKT